MASTTWVGGDSGNETDWNTGANWSTGSIPTTNAHVVIANTGHNCALDTTRTIGSLTIQAGATIVGGGNKLIIQSEGDASGGTEHYALKNDGIVSGNLHLEFTYAGETAADFNGSSGNFNDIKLNAASVDLNQVGVATFDSLIIVANATYDAGNDGLTVTGDVSCSGTFLGNSTTTISHNSLTINSGGIYSATNGTTTIVGVYSSPFALSNSGTFTNNDGTLLLNRAGNQEFLGTWTGSSALHNLTIDGGNGTKKIRANMLIEGDLDVTASDAFTTHGNTETITVDGNVTVSGTLGATTQTGAYSFGSLAIASGGTFIATSGTTTITGGNSASGYSFKADGTFTHNNGKMLFDFTPSQNWYTEANTYYDLELKYNNNTYSFRMTDDSGNAIKILNNLTVTAGMFEMHTTSDTLDIYGNTYINGGIFESESDQDTNKITHHGLVTINSGTYKINDGTTVKMNGGIRNMGTITVA